MWSEVTMGCWFADAACRRHLTSVGACSFGLSVEEREALLEGVKDDSLRDLRRGDALSWLEWHFVQIQKGALAATELHTAWVGGSDTPLVQGRADGPNAPIWQTTPPRPM